MRKEPNCQFWLLTGNDAAHLPKVDAYVLIRDYTRKGIINWVPDNVVIDTICNSQGNRQPFVMETVKADDNAKFGFFSLLKVKVDISLLHTRKGPSQPVPRFIGNLIVFVLNLIGPKGLEFARYSLDYHTIRNYMYVNRTWGKQRADRHIPSYAKKLVDAYNQNGVIDQMLTREKPSTW
ncbi:hypothetical protein GOBAR_AA07514 [Gossypium barbadense]|uniref:Uncharacterized protein n=1 Tax=Gossypium barbadense TaxID=3634 RepID=A0A2P5YC64_GOSBA|nr:hypothetical protein GOBAR_AA07514 [Gossypium barbadense]